MIKKLTAMAHDGQRVKKNKISYWNSIFSMSTVLFLTGFLSVFIWMAKKTSDSLIDNVVIQIELIDTTHNAYNEYMKKIKAIDEVNHVSFISKDVAAEKLKKQINEDFISIIGYNPLFNSMEVSVKSDFFTGEVFEKLKERFLANHLVKNATYPKVVAKSLNKNLRKVSLFIGALTFFLLLIAVVLIDSTIRLAMFSDRFLIKSMQLVGATRWFIIKPYIWRSILNGIVSGLFASGFLLIVLQLFSKYSELIDVKAELKYLVIIFFGLILLGIIISSISTIFAVRKYLRIKLDSLY